MGLNFYGIFSSFFMMVTYYFADLNLTEKGNK